MNDASSDGWVRSAYMGTQYKTGDARIADALAPAVPINVRHPGAASDSKEVVRGRAVLDTGAHVSAAPMWAARRLGIELDEKTKQLAFGASGTFKAYLANIRVAAALGATWDDIGVVKVLFPDTEASRDPTSRVPFLLGRNGFFSKYSACFDEGRKEVWLRRAEGNPPVAAIL